VHRFGTTLLIAYVFISMAAVRIGSIPIRQDIIVLKCANRICRVCPDQVDERAMPINSAQQWSCSDAAL